MIISHKEKFIFVHCRKVAGSSIKVELSRHLGNEDIIIGSIHELAKNNIEIPLSVWRNALSVKGIVSLPLRVARGYGFYEALNESCKYKFKKALTENPVHPPAYLVKKAFPYEWENYFKFGFVRNPYDRIISDYLWVKNSAKTAHSFREYLDALVNVKNNSIYIHKGGVSNLDMIAIDGEISIDYIGRFENLHDDFAYICNSIGLSSTSLLAKEKQNINSASYKSYYGKFEYDLAKLIVSKEAELFGYTFPYEVPES